MDPYPLDRRSFLGCAGAGVLLARLPGDRGPSRRRSLDELDPVRAWVIETPREKVLELAAGELRKGLPPGRLLDAIYLAAVEEIRPHPVGFKFHAVMVAHPVARVMATASGPEALLPLLWYLDDFKASQARDVEQGEWKLGPAPEKGLPPAGQEIARLRTALEAWDAEAADLAVTAAARATPLPEVFDILFESGTRCARDIGHKAITTAMAWHMLRRLDRSRAEPVLRSLVAAQLDGGKTRLAEPFEENRARVAAAQEAWEAGRHDPGAAGLLPVLRSATGAEASRAAFDALKKGVGPATLWDAIASAASELVIQRPEIVSLHAVTSMNALRTIAAQASRAQVRLLALLQAADWITHFRDRLFRGALPDDALRIDDPPPEGAAKDPSGFREILATAAGDRAQAIRLTRAATGSSAGQDQLSVSIPGLLVASAADVHELKLGVAVMEEWERAGAVARRHLLLAAAQHLPDPREEPEILARIRQTLGRR